MTDEPAWTLVTTATYERALRRFLRKHPDLRQAHADTLRLLAANPFHPALRLHDLRGELAGAQAVRVTYSYRIVLTLLVAGREIVLLDIGAHDEVYR